MFSLSELDSKSCQCEHHRSDESFHAFRCKSRNVQLIAIEMGKTAALKQTRQWLQII